MMAIPSSDPIEVIVDRQERVLIITWRDNHRSVYPFDNLRRDCPCATCNDARDRRPHTRELLVLSGPVVKPGEVQITSYRPVGWYALNFTWSDGHDTGIYTYESLRAACPCEQCVGAAPAP
ncbi:MAG: hypothetical protein C3F08_05120 [Candidatus Methylomirabilota bacterium]|nr:MAG: hypothetical protein C3F08_05120 [candidate division NC10 bacterium]